MLIKRSLSHSILLSLGIAQLQFGIAKADVSGTVEKPDGTPASDTRVFFIPGQKDELTLFFSKGKGELENRATVGAIPFLVIERVNWSMHTTGSDGKFSFASTNGNFLIVAVGDSGFGIITQKSQSSVLRLDEWKTVRGRLFLRGQHAKAHEAMILECPWMVANENVKIMFQDLCETDQDGKFVFPRVPAKGARVARGHGSSPAEQTEAEWVEFDEQKDVTLELNRNSGVEGRLHLPMQFAWTKASGSLELISNGPNERQIDPADWWRPGVFKTWLSARTYRFPIEKDGSFRIDDVRPGAYTLALRAVTTPSRLLAGLTMPLDVRPDEGYRKVDLGNLELFVPQELKIGLPVPNLSANTLDNVAFELRQKRRQFVLLEFWGTWCAPCRAEVEIIQKLHKKFSADQLVVVDLAIDDDRDRVREFVRKNDMPWTHIVLGDKYSTAVPSQFGITAVPKAFLISPDGNLVFSGRGPELVQATENAISHLDK